MMGKAIGVFATMALVVALIGMDAYGFYISTNEFPVRRISMSCDLLGADLHGTQIYAMSKWALAAGTYLPPVVHLAGFDPFDGGLTVRPASSPNGRYETANGGTEYLVGAFPFAPFVDNKLALWTLANTTSLGTPSPYLTMTRTLVPIEDVASVPDAEQQPGPTPLAEFLETFAPPQHLLVLEGVDREPSQVTYARGLHLTAFDTSVQPERGGPKLGSAWFVLDPRQASVVAKGYVSTSNLNVMNPAIAVNDQGQAAIGFSLSGPDIFPSAGYARLDLATSVGLIHARRSRSGALRGVRLPHLWRGRPRAVGRLWRCGRID